MSSFGTEDKIVARLKAEIERLKKVIIFLIRHNAIAWKHLESLYAIKKFIRLGLYDVAHESWEEIPQDDQIILNRAKSKGGFFEPFERQIAVKGMDSRTGYGISEKVE